jgi:hypothetical protein
MVVLSKRQQIEAKTQAIVAKTNKTDAQKTAMNVKIQAKLDILYPGSR